MRVVRAGFVFTFLSYLLRPWLRLNKGIIIIFIKNNQGGRKIYILEKFSVAHNGLTTSQTIQFGMRYYTVFYLFILILIFSLLYDFGKAGIFPF